MARRSAAGLRMEEPPGQSSQPSPQQALIARIRRRYYQDSPELSGADKEDADANLATIAGQAALLSDQLYQQPTHFVLELVQNADDCSMPPGVQPQVVLALLPDALLFATNEAGFDEANVRAICDMSKSTKSRQAGAFTGEKGIGFKATAVVSEVTFISSNGFTFAFDLRRDAYSVPHLGLVCPRWEANLTARMEGWLTERLAGTGVASQELLAGMSTRMWMQLRRDVDWHHLARQLEQLDPHMLLNLRQLRSMTVLTVQQDSTCHMRRLLRADHGPASMTLTVQAWQPGAGGDKASTRTHLLCMRQELQVPHAVSADEEKRQGVDSTEVVFALRQTADGTADPDPHSSLFAFLPVRAYGFRFHVQADFVLPASREGILENRPWNVWLRDQLAGVFKAQAMRAAGSDGPCLRPDALLQFLPLPGEVQDAFMQEVSTAIMDSMRQQACVLTASGQLALPGATLLPAVLLERSSGTPLVSNEWLAAGLPGHQFACASLMAGSQEQQARAEAVLLELGSRRFTTRLLLQWLVAPGTAQLLRGLPVQQRTGWLRDLFRCFSAQLITDTQHPQWQWQQELLLQAPILQLQGSGALRSKQELGSRGVYLWDARLGQDDALQLFCPDTPAADAGQHSGAGNGSSSSGGGGGGGGSGSGSDGAASALCIIDRATLPPGGELLLQQLLDVPLVPLSVLVRQLLQDQALARSRMEPGSQLVLHHQQLLFLLRVAHQVSTSDMDAVRSALLLLQQQLPGAAPSSNAQGGSSGSSSSGPDAAAPAAPAVRPASQLFLPLQHTSTLPSLPPALLRDGSLASDLARHGGVHWVSEGYAGQVGAQLQGSLWGLLQHCGVQQMVGQQLAIGLLAVYCTAAGRASIRRAQHVLHLEAMQPCALPVQRIREGIWLYAADADPEAQPPNLAVASLFGWQLYWQPPGSKLPRHTFCVTLRRRMFMALLHACYAQAGTGCAQLVKQLAEELTPDQVLQRMLRLHSSSFNLAAAARDAGVSVDELLLEQLQYLAAVRSQLSGVQPTNLGGSFLLPDSTGELVPSSQLHLPPQESSALALLDDLQGSRTGLQLLHPVFSQAAAEDEEQRLVLTKLLGVRQATGGALIRVLADLHASDTAAGSSDGSSIPEEQRVRLLHFVAHHLPVLEQDQQLREHVQRSVRLLDAQGAHAAPRSLSFALLPEHAPLEASVLAGGMRVLHSSYMAPDSSGGSSSSSSGASRQQAVSHAATPRQLRELLRVLGVKETTASDVVCFAMQLYPEAAAAEAVAQPPVTAEQHLTHLAFIQERWALLSAAAKAAVTGRMQLLVLDSSGRGGSSSSSSSFRRPAGDVYFQPRKDSDAHSLLCGLQLGGASFLDATAYAGISAALEHWLCQALGVAVLAPAAAADHLLRAHLSGQLAADAQELVQHARFIALRGSESLKEERGDSLLLALDGCGSSTVQASSDLYYPAAGEGWRLDEVLLPGEVQYLHPAYTQLQGDDHRMVLELLAQLGVHTRLPPDARQLQHTIVGRGRWQPLLLCLRDTWASYCPTMQAQFVRLLQDLQVTTGSGQPHALRDCFLPSACRNISAELLQLMQQLELPILELQQPQDERWGPLLAAFGVSTSLDWGALQKVLTQLSSSGAAPKLDSMVSLYERVHALCMVDVRTAAAVCQAFREQPLVFLPPSDKQRPQAQWLTSTRVLWAGCSEWYPDKHFISCHYLALDSFFTKQLGVRSATVDDIKDALLYFAERPVGEGSKVVPAMYAALARRCASRREKPPGWLASFFGQQRVLLVEAGGAPFYASARTHAPIYLPDDAALQQLFRGDVTMLAVRAELAPALQPLLKCLRPGIRLPRLSSSVSISYAAGGAAAHAAAAGSGTAGGSGIIGLWRRSLPVLVQLGARYLYYKHSAAFMSLHADGSLQQLLRVQVQPVPNLVQQVALGGVSKQVPAVAMLQLPDAAVPAREQRQRQQGSGSDGAAAGTSSDSGAAPASGRLLLNSTCTNAVQLSFTIAEACASWLCGRHPSLGGSPDARDKLANKLTSLAKSIGRAAVQEAEQELDFQGVGHVPPELRFWSIEQQEQQQSQGTGPEGRGATATGLGAADTLSSRPLADDAASSSGSSSMHDGGIDGAEPINGQASQVAAAEAAAAAAAGAADCSAAPDIAAALRALHISREAAAAADSGTPPPQLRSQPQEQQPQVNPGPGADFEAVTAAAAAVEHLDLEQLVRCMVSQGASAAPGWRWPVLPGEALHAQGSAGSTPGSSAGGTPAGDSGGASDASTDDVAAAAATAAAAAATAAAAAAATGSSSGSGAAGDDGGAPAAAAAPGRSSSDAYHLHEDQAKLIGDLGERYLFELLRRQLPGFDGSCWASGSRTSAGLPPLAGPEPPYDFLYHDEAGLLSGTPGTSVFLECKATTHSVVEEVAAGQAPHPAHISANEWELARHLHEHPEEGMFVVARVDRVRHAQGPRLVALLRDPVGLLREATLWVTSGDLLLCDYPLTAPP